VNFPLLVKKGISVKDFVPQGWSIECEEKGDISKDGIADLVFLLQQNNPGNVIIKKGGYGVDTLNSNPRILAVALGLPSGKEYKLVVENHTLIPRYTDPTLSDPLSGCPIIEKSALHITLGFWANAGTWSTSNSTFIFWYQDTCLRLIGYDYNSSQRNTGEFHSKSINYLTKKIKRETGTIDDDKGEIVWSKLTGRTFVTIDDIGDGLGFDQ
jgi:hypothetical protein